MSGLEERRRSIERQFWAQSRRLRRASSKPAFHPAYP